MIDHERRSLDLLRYQAEPELLLHSRAQIDIRRSFFYRRAGLACRSATSTRLARVGRPKVRGSTALCGRSRWAIRLLYLNRLGALEEHNMKNSTKDQAAGKVHEVKGAVKEKVGRATNDPVLENEGTDEKVGGKIQKKIGQVEKVLGA